MTAQQRYLSSVNLSFSHFLAKQAVADHIKDEAILLLLEVMAEIKTDQAWHTQEVLGLIGARGRNIATQPALKIVTEFVQKYQPHQAGVYLFEYLLSLKNSNCSPSTIKNYRSDINQFIDFVGETNLDNLLNKPKVIDFLKSQRSKGLKSATIIRKLASISQFTQWTEQEGLVYDQPSMSEGLLGLRAQILDDDSAQEIAETEPKNEYIPKPREDRTWSLPFSLESVGLATGGLSSALAKTSTSDQETARGRQDYRARVKSSLSSFSGISEKIRDKMANAPSLLLPYTNLAMILLLVLGLGVFGYQQFIRDASLPFAYPSTPTRPNRTLSFQGRLTDTAQNPITSATDMRFYLYDTGPGAGGIQLWDSGTCSVTPDQDGIFSVGLGDACGSEIGSGVFSENANVWLQVAIEAETLTPRQSIKSVAYALNSETLQGYPINSTGSATVNTVVTMNSGGEIVLGEVSPTIRSVSGTFSIEAQSMLLQTNSGSNGNIVIDPDGTGIVQVLSSLTDLHGYLAAPGATISATYAGGKALVVKGGPSGTANIQEWQNSAGTALSVVDEAGSLGIGTSNPSWPIHVEGSTTTYNGITYEDADSTAKVTVGEMYGYFGITAQGTNDIYIATHNINSSNGPYAQFGSTTGSIGFTAAYYAPASKFGDIYFQTGGSNTNRIYIHDGGNVGIGTDTSPDYYFDVQGIANFDSDVYLASTTGNVGIGTTNPANFKLQITGDIGPTTDSAHDLGSATFAWAEIYGDAIYQNGNAVCDSSGNCASLGNYWRLASGALSPVNDTLDLLVGSTASASAKFAFINVNGGTPSASISANSGNIKTYLTGDGTLSTTNRQTLSIGGTPTGNISFAPGGAVAGTWLTNGNLGIGDTSPAAMLSVGSGDLFQVNSSGIIAAIDNVAHTIDDISGDLTLTSNSTNITLNDSVTVAGALAVNGGSITTDDASFNLLNATATTINFGGAATILELGAATGTTSVNNALTVDGNTTLGNAITDSITFTGRAASDLLPITDSAHDLGSSSLAWAEIYGDAIYQGGNQVCDISGTGCPVGSAVYWRLTNGALSPINNTLDVLVGSNATASAKFAFINVNGGTPSASISANSGNIKTYLTGDGTLATTNRQSLTIGNSSTYNSTGNVLIHPNGTGYVGIGATAPDEKLTIRDGNMQISSDNSDAYIRLKSDELLDATSAYIWTENAVGLAFGTVAGTPQFVLTTAGTNGRVGIGTTAPLSRLSVNGDVFAQTATISATYAGGKALVLKGGPSGTANIQEWQNSAGTPLTVVDAGGNIGIGTATPGVALGVGSASNFSVSSSGIITKIDNVAHTIDDVAGDLTLTSNSTNISLNDNVSIAGTTGLTFTGVGGQINFTNGETIDNDTDGTVNVGSTILLLTGGTTLSTNQTTFNLINTTATTLNFGGAATTLELGAATGTTSVNNALTVDGNTTLGNAITDSITFTGRAASDLLPITDSAHDLGSSSLAWAEIYGDAIYQNGNLVCDSSGANCPAGAGNYWRLNSGALSPVNDTLDLLVGSTASASAKFAFINVNGGTPSASISANSGNIKTYLTGDGILSTTDRQTLSIGGTPTGNISFVPGGAVAGTWLTNGNLGIGTTSPVGLLNVTGRPKGKALVILDETGDQNIITASASGTTVMNLSRTGDLSAARFLDITNSNYLLDPAAAGTSLAVAGNVGIGTTTPGVALGIGSTSNFSVSSSGIITKIDNVAHTIDDISGDLTLTSNSTNISLNDNATIAGTTGLTFTGVGGQINFTNGESIDNDTDNRINLRLGTAGTLLLTSTTSSTISNSAGSIILDSAGGTIDINDGTIDLSTQIVAVTLNSAVDALNFDSNTLSIDATNNRIGIGDAAPSSTLEVSNAALSGSGVRLVELNGTITSGANNQGALQVNLQGAPGGTLVLADSTSDNSSAVVIAHKDSLNSSFTSVSSYRATASLGHATNGARTADNIIGYYAIPTGINHASSVLTNYYGFAVSGNAESRITNKYGLYVGSMTGGTLNYSIFTAGGDLNFDFNASDEMVVDAATVDSTGTTGVIDLNLDSTSSQQGINIDAEVIDDNAVDTLSGVSITMTNSADDSDVVYGLHVANLGGSASGGNEFAIYQAGTSWDYGLYIEDSALFNTTLEVNGNTIGLNYDASANNVISFGTGPGEATGDLYWGDDLLCDASATTCGWTAGNILWNDIGAPDGNLTLDHTTHITAFNTDTTTTDFFTVNANSLTTGTAFTLASTSTTLTSGGLFEVVASGNPGGSWTGELAKFEITGNAATIDASALKVGVTASSTSGSASTALNVTSAGPSNGSFVARFNDDGTYTDSTPIVITGDGYLTLGATTADALLDVNGAGNFDFGATDNLTLDAATTDFTSSSGVLTIDLDAVNSGKAIRIDLETITDSSSDAMSGIYISATQTSTDNDDIYGLHVVDLGGLADAGNEYAIYQAGTAWDYGLFVEDAAFFGNTIDVNGTEITLDADADTSITASTDDQIDIEIAGADDFTFTANAFNALTSSDIITSNLGVNFTDSDTNPGCAAGEYKIYADTSETILKKCINGSASDLDTNSGGATAWSAIAVPTGNLSLAHSTHITAFNSDTTTTNFFTVNANSLTTGTAFNLASTSTALTSGGLFNATWSGAPAASWTGSLATIEITGNDADIDGSALKVGITSSSTAGSASTALNVTSAGPSGAYVVRFNDDGSYTDSTPFVIDSAGNVGIGTTAPESKLHVFNAASGASRLPDALIYENSANAYVQVLGGTSSERTLAFGDSSHAVDGAIKFNASDGTANGLSFAVNGNNTHMVLTSAGNVGIGTLTANQKLQVQGNIRATSLASCNTIGSDSDGDFTCNGAYSTRDAAGGQNITAAGIVVNQDTESFPHADFTLGSNEITLEQAGTYFIMYSCGAQANANAQFIVNCYLEIDADAAGVGGFAEIPGSRCQQSVRTNSVSPNQSCTSSAIVESDQVNEEVRLSAIMLVDNGTDPTTVDEQSNITIIRLGEGSADLAEVYYTNDPSVEAGSVVSVDPANPGAGVKSSNGTYDANVMGVISTQPHTIMGIGEGNYTGRQVALALTGRVPVKVTGESGPIVPGDYLTSASKPGFAMKATQPGVVLGSALTEFIPDSPEDEGTVVVFVNRTSYNPTLKITDVGELNMLGSKEDGYQLTQFDSASPTSTQPLIVSRIEAFAQVAVANLRAGAVNTQDLVVERTAQIAELSVESLTVGGQTLRDYIQSVVSDISAPAPAPELVSPVAIDDQTLDTNINIATAGARVAFNNSQNETIAELSEAGDLTLLGKLSASEIEAEQMDVTSARIERLESQLAEFEAVKAQTADILAADIGTATISGTLYANDIYNFEERIATALEKPTLLQTLLAAMNEMNPANPGQPPASETEESIDDLYQTVDSVGIATNSASLNKTLADLNTDGDDVVIEATAVFINQYFKVNGTAYIADSLGIGNSLVIGQGTRIADGLIEYHNPNYISGQPGSQVLAIQPSGKGTISLLAGLMTLDESGNVNISGNLSVAGNLEVKETLLTNLVQPADYGNPFQVQVAGIATESGLRRESRFEIVNEFGSPVATISAQGRATFASGIGVGTEDLTQQTAQNNEASTTQTSGKATIIAGQSQITINTKLLNSNSLVYVTPSGSTGNQVLYLKSQNPAVYNGDQNENDTQIRLINTTPGSIIVGFDNPAQQDVTFNWWIVN